MELPLLLDADRDGKRCIVRSDEKLTGFRIRADRTAVRRVLDRRRDDLCAGESRRRAPECSAVRATIFARTNLVSVLFLFTVKMGARLRGQYS